MGSLGNFQVPQNLYIKHIISCFFFLLATSSLFNRKRYFHHYHCRKKSSQALPVH